MTRLTVLYDTRCGLCCALHDWIGRQPMLIPLDCRPTPEPTDDLLVVADTGEAWAGDSAWLMVLWALREYRHLSYRLAGPAFLPLARRAFALVSKYRGSLSCSLGLTAEQVAASEVTVTHGNEI
jgi:predicted DCC family thiol-disulfide oxidoreductase YuxK